MLPLLKHQAQQGNRVPSRLPNLELSDIDPDPEKAKEILDAYQKNLPKYLENGKDTLFTKDDEWQVPPVSTELRIFGSKKDNTTPQVVDAIKKVAGVTSDAAVDAVKREDLLTKEGTLPATDFDRQNRSVFKKYQQIFGEALIEKYPEYKDVLRETLTRYDLITTNVVDSLEQKLLGEGYGEKYLTREEQAEILSKYKDQGYSMEDWDKVQREFFTKNIIQRYKPTDPKGEIEGGPRWEPGNFGPRYLTTLAGGSAKEPQYLWQKVVK